MTECPHCANRIGFVFGTCTECGWNTLTNTFEWIRVRTGQYQPGAYRTSSGDPDELLFWISYDGFERLIAKHAAHTDQMFARKEPQ